MRSPLFLWFFFVFFFFFFFFPPFFFSLFPVMIEDVLRLSPFFFFFINLSSEFFSPPYSLRERSDIRMNLLPLVLSPPLPLPSSFLFSRFSFFPLTPAERFQEQRREDVSSPFPAFFFFSFSPSFFRSPSSTAPSERKSEESQEKRLSFFPLFFLSAPFFRAFFLNVRERGALLFGFFFPLRVFLPQARVRERKRITPRQVHSAGLTLFSSEGTFHSSLPRLSQELRGAYFPL